MDIGIRTDKTVGILRKLPNGWGGDTSKKPSVKAINKTKKVLNELEVSRMPWPSIIPVPTGGVVMTWASISRDIMVIIDSDGDIQFSTSLKKIDLSSGEVVERLDADGHITDLSTLSHMLAWFCTDQAAPC